MINTKKSKTPERLLSGVSYGNSIFEFSFLFLNNVILFPTTCTTSALSLLDISSAASLPVSGAVSKTVIFIISLASSASSNCFINFSFYSNNGIFIVDRIIIV